MTNKDTDKVAIFLKRSMFSYEFSGFGINKVIVLDIEQFNALTLTSMKTRVWVIYINNGYGISGAPNLAML